MRMSPTSRGRRARRQPGKSSRSDVRSVRRAPEVEDCDCSVCTAGPDVDPNEVLGQLLDDVAPLLDVEDALDAELAGAAFRTLLAPIDDDQFPEFLAAFVPAVESRPGAAALALLRLLGSAAPGTRPKGAEIAAAAADRMAAAGVSEPAWAAELAEPGHVSDCARLSDNLGALSLLVASFRRAGRGHAFVVVVEETHCGAAADIAARVVPQQVADRAHAEGGRQRLGRPGPQCAGQRFAERAHTWQHMSVDRQSARFACGHAIG